MSQEENQKMPPVGGETPSPAPEPPTPERKPSRSRPVKIYLTVLFCAALLLLLISFVMQQRNHMALQDLNEAIEGSQQVTDLQLENQRLQFELEEKEDLEAQVEEQQRQIEALEWLRQIEAAVRKSYSEAKALVEAFEETGLESSLPTQSSVEGAEAPADTYRQIYAMLF